MSLNSMHWLGPTLIGVILAGCGGSSGGPPPAGPEPPAPPPPTEPPGGGLDARPVNTTCVAPARPSGLGAIELERAFPALSFEQPLYLLQAPGDDARWFVLEKTGRVRVFDNQASVATSSVFLDLSSVVNSASEGGLLGLAFAPDFATSGRAFVSYTTFGPGGTGMRSVIARYRSPDGGLTLDPASEQVLLTITQPFNNHNGGGIKFGPDGHLYVAIGDGGSGGDPQDNAQNTHNLLGAFLRLEVDDDGAYEVPAGNPFAQNPRCAEGSGAAPCPEIFAWGLRNPWRFSFDRQSGRLWAGDVGQNAREEINLIEVGGNYGWRFREGFTCFNPATNCPAAGLVDPVLDYPHSDGRSVTGGYVVRGTSLPGLEGLYLFGDFISGRIWALSANADGEYGKSLLAATGLQVSSFGEANDGEIFVVDFGGGLYRIKPAGNAPADTIPASLADTGCVDPAVPSLPAPGLIPYRPQAPFWSDGAAKERWLALPEGTTIGLDGDGRMDFPAGSVLMKHFRRDGRLLETRLFMRHPDGVWAGYTYGWNEAQTAAGRITGGAQRETGGRAWLYPSEAECLQCHTAAAGRTLGLELAQLNGVLTYPATGRVANQLRTLDAIGLFSPPLGAAPEDIPSLADPNGVAAVEERARAWLHTNCAGCHRPGGPTPSDLDLRFDTALAAMAACRVPTITGSDLGVSDASLLSPGAPARSLIWLRPGRRDVHAMPPLGSLEVDTAGLDVVREWIESLQGCE